MATAAEANDSGEVDATPTKVEEVAKAAGEAEAEADVKAAVSTMRALLDQLERGEASDEVSAKLNAEHAELQSLLGKRKAPEAEP